jgi:hypothetical protein
MVLILYIMINFFNRFIYMLVQSILLAVVMMVIMSMGIIWVINNHLENIALPYKDHALRLVQEGGGGGGAKEMKGGGDEVPQEIEDSQGNLKGEVVELGSSDRPPLEGSYLLGDNPIEDIWAKRWGLAKGSQYIVQLPNYFEG